MKTLKIYKIGGEILNNKDYLTNFLKKFSLIKNNKILIHGGGKQANEILKKLNIIPNIIKGRRITNFETLEVLISIYSGLINKRVVAELQKYNCNALGLSGCDGNVIKGVKRVIKKINFGYVGDLDKNSINIELIKLLILNGITPVFSAIIHDGKGNLLNTNADSIAASISTRLVNDFDLELNFCFDKIGVLNDINDEKSIIEVINEEYFKLLVNKNMIHSGMIPKLENSFLVLKEGVKKVFLRHAKNIDKNICTKII